MKKCLIAMSGGVDSAVAALLVKNMNIECIGATMKLLGGGGIELDEEHACCSKEDIEDAKRLPKGLVWSTIYTIFLSILLRRL